MPDEERFPEPPSDDDIRRRFSELRDQLNADPEISELSDDVVDAKREELVSGVGGSKFPEPPSLEVKRPQGLGAKLAGKSDKQNTFHGDDAEGYRGLAVGLSVAYSLVGFVILGWAVGWLIDRVGGRGLGQAFCTLIGGILGLISAVMIITRSEKR